MKIKKTIILIDNARCIYKNIMCFIEMENIKDFITSIQNLLGEKHIDTVKHEVYDNINHTLTVHQADIDPMGDAERTVIYEWEG